MYDWHYACFYISLERTTLWFQYRGGVYIEPEGLKTTVTFFEVGDVTSKAVHDATL